MLSVYTRHYPPCMQTDLNYRRCKCPKWVQGTIEGKPGFLRLSAKTRSWEQAERTARKLETAAIPSLAQTTMTDAVLQYVAMKDVARLSANRMRHVRGLFERILLPWCQARQLLSVKHFTTPILLEFLQSRKIGALAARTEYAMLNNFFKFCLDQMWLEKNPMKGVRAPKADCAPTDYFSREEFQRIVAATSKLAGGHDHTAEQVQQRARAHILLMRYSGLAIQDATMLGRERLAEDNTLILRRAKTGVAVFVPLPAYVADELRQVVGGDATHFFWSGRGVAVTTINNFRRIHYRVYRHALLEKRAHPHMLRDTFAVELLLAGVPLDQVATLLGHSSIKTTEQHYAPFVKARQDQLIASVNRAWGTPSLQLIKKAGA